MFKAYVYCGRGYCTSKHSETGSLGRLLKRL